LHSWVISLFKSSEKEKGNSRPEATTPALKQANQTPVYEAELLRPLAWVCVSQKWAILDKVLRLMRACLQHLTKHGRTRRKICYMNRDRYYRCMSIRTLFAIVGALITGGAMLAIPHLSQVAEARLALN
jgi:hypothetical protein